MTTALSIVVRSLAVTGGAAVIALTTAGMASAAALPTPAPSGAVVTITPDDGAAPVVLRAAAGNEYLTLTAGPTRQLRVRADLVPVKGADVVANESGTGVVVQIARDGVVEHDVPLGNGARWWFTA